MNVTPFSEIESISFSIAGNLDNDKEAYVTVTDPLLFRNGEPVVSGCFDNRMGITDNTHCGTCLFKKKQCQGHGGKMQSALPLESPLFVHEIRKWLKIICLECGGLMMAESKMDKILKTRRFGEMSTKTPTSMAKCPYCGERHPKIEKDPEDNFSINAVYTSDTGKVTVEKIFPSRMKQIFQRVTDETVAKVGKKSINHPSKLVLDNIYVPPIMIRPITRTHHEATNNSTHFLTNIFQNIVKRNIDLTKMNIKGDIFSQTPSASDAAGLQLQREIECKYQAQRLLYHNAIIGSASSSAAPTVAGSGKREATIGTKETKSIIRNFARKEGRIRKNLLGKRVWNISRSTISGNPHLQVDEVGYPLAFAKTLKIKEVVHPFNRDRLLKFFLNGAAYPGCSGVIKWDNPAGVVTAVTKASELENNDTIIRDVVTGDYGFFNRAPSLERSAIGAHRIVVLEDPKIHTIQMNVIACAWYGADFDGDQMNLWVPHTIASRVEARVLSNVTNWFISTKSSAPVNGQVQDSNISSFELTRDGVRMRKLEAMSLFATTSGEAPDFRDTAPGGLVKNLAIVSHLFADAPINYDRKTQWYHPILEPFIDYKPRETSTKIENGVLKYGVFDKKSIGDGVSDGIFHRFALKYSSSLALKKVFNLQQMSIKFADIQGCSIGTSDMVVDKKALGEIFTIIRGIETKSQQITRELILGDIVPPIDMTTHEYYESQQKETLKTPDDLLRPIIQSIDPDNNTFYKMIATGSKGSLANLKHIMGFIGQVEINNKRMMENFSFRRTLPYFPRFDTSPDSYGFVRNSYIQGMTPPEYIFSAMNGRFDLISKALMTANTGYQNRKSVLALQSNIIDNARRVVKNTKVVQVLFGDDGFDTRFVELVPFRTVFLDDVALGREFAYRPPESAPKEMKDFFREELETIREDRDFFRKAAICLENMDITHPLSNLRQVPQNIQRLVIDVEKAKDEGAAKEVGAAELMAMCREVRGFCAKVPFFHLNENYRRLGEKAYLPDHIPLSTRLFQMLIRIELSAPVLAKKRFTAGDLQSILHKIQIRFTLALIDYGSTVGINAAQSVSQPLTQYMLDSHHRSVSGGTTKAGIIRPSEIFSVKPLEAESDPRMLLRLLPEFEADETAALEVAKQIEIITLDRLVLRWNLLFENDYAQPLYPLFLHDSEWLDEFILNTSAGFPADMTSWCLRLQLDRMAMVHKGISMRHVVLTLYQKHPHVFLFHNSDNHPDPVIRIRFRSGAFNRKQPNKDRLVEITSKEILPTVLRGVPRIREARVKKVARHYLTPEGGVVARNVFAIETSGSNIYGVLMDKRIDPTNIVSTSIGDNEKMFGVTSARDTIVREIRRIMGGQAVNIRHLLLYADEMVFSGRATSLEKSGVAVREKDNVFLRMGMAAPSQVILDAATSNITTKVHGPIPSLIMGKTPNVGTTWNSFIYDEDYIQANTKSIDEEFDSLHDLLR